MDARKGSNALVSVVDFYSAAVADLQGLLDQQTKVINALGDQLKERDRIITAGSQQLDAQLQALRNDVAACMRELRQALEKAGHASR